LLLKRLSLKHLVSKEAIELLQTHGTTLLRERHLLLELLPLLIDLSLLVPSFGRSGLSCSRSCRSSQTCCQAGDSQSD
jgi:hypothetical protein